MIKTIHYNEITNKCNIYSIFREKYEFRNLFLIALKNRHFTWGSKRHERIKKYIKLLRYYNALELEGYQAVYIEGERDDVNGIYGIKVGEHSYYAHTSVTFEYPQIENLFIHSPPDELLFEFLPDKLKEKIRKEITIGEKHELALAWLLLKGKALQHSFKAHDVFKKRHLKKLARAINHYIWNMGYEKY